MANSSATRNAIARNLNPLHARIFKPAPMDYYWSAYQTEWASDLMFKDPRSLAQVYPALVRHAMLQFQSPDVMRFLGRKAHGNFLGDLETSFKDRAEGVRIKHWARGNSVKIYDKAASVLRVETTVGNTSDFKVFRPRHDDPDGPLDWRPRRKGVADLHRRAQVSQRSNDAYLDALASASDDTPASDVFHAVSQPTSLATSGFRNRDVRPILFATNNVSDSELRRLSARVSRLLRILRAHRVVNKIPKTHRYRLTSAGNLLTAALFAARSAGVSQLLAKAA